MTDPIEIRTDRVGVLVEQLTEAAGFTRQRLTDLDDEEFNWEPVAGAWSVRLRADATTPDAFGPGDFVLDLDKSIGPFDPGPVTTMSWRIGHLSNAFAGRWDWTFGTHSIEPSLAIEFDPSAEVMLGQLWQEIDRWVLGVDSLSDEQLDRPGFGQYPNGLDRELPFIGIVRWMNREFIHHAAEVALLRDLYRPLSGRDGS